VNKSGTGGLGSAAAIQAGTRKGQYISVKKRKREKPVIGQCGLKTSVRDLSEISARDGSVGKTKRSPALSGGVNYDSRR